MRERNETPVRRTNPSGKVVFVARHTGPDGKRTSAGTFKLKGPCRDKHDDGQCCAQHAIWKAYESPVKAAPTGPTVRAYLPAWLERHPRAERTNHTNNRRIRKLFEVDVEGVPFADWPLSEVRPRHIHILVAHMLTVDGRARTGALNMLGSLSAMFSDARRDDLTEINPCRDVRIRHTDPRIQKGRRQIRVWSWEEMHRLAAHSENPAMVRVMSDCGLRLGEVLALERQHWHGDTLEVRQTAWRRQISAGDKTSHGKEDSGRVVPVPADLQRLLREMPPRIDSPYLFPDAKGRVWRENNWRRDFWEPARQASEIDATPHELRHSWSTHMQRAAGVDRADLAIVAGHSIKTMVGTYRHALNSSDDAIRRAVGS